MPVFTSRKWCRVHKFSRYYAHKLWRYRTRNVSRAQATQIRSRGSTCGRSISETSASRWTRRSATWNRASMRPRSAAGPQIQEKHPAPIPVQAVRNSPPQPFDAYRSIRDRYDVLRFISSPTRELSLALHERPIGCYPARDATRRRLRIRPGPAGARRPS